MRRPSLRNYIKLSSIVLGYLLTIILSQSGLEAVINFGMFSVFPASSAALSNIHECKWYKHMLFHKHRPSFCPCICQITQCYSFRATELLEFLPFRSRLLLFPVHILENIWGYSCWEAVPATVCRRYRDQRWIPSGTRFDIGRPFLRTDSSGLPKFNYFALEAMRHQRIGIDYSYISVKV